MDLSSDQLFEVFFSKTHFKSPNEINNVIKILFESPNGLIERMSNLKNNEEMAYESGLNIPQISILYENIHLFGMDNQLLKIYNNSFKMITSLPELKTFLKSANEMKYFFIVTLWDKLFIEENYQTLYQLLELVQKAQYYNQIFIAWLRDLPTEYVKIIIKSLHKRIEKECNALVQKEQTEENNKILGHNCQIICNFLKLLNASNKITPRAPNSQFNSAFLTKFFEPIQAFKIYLKKASQFNFMLYPFLLDFDYKYKVMQIQSIYEQKMSIKKNMENGLMNLIQNIENGIEGLIYLYFAVNRHNILDDSMEKLGKIKQNLKSPLRIEFIGEEGADEGGVKNQYFSLITKAIFNPYLDMFLPKNNGRFYWFNGFSYELPLRFEFMGMLLGLSLYNSVHLDIHFPEITYKKLLNKKYEEDYGIQIVEDLKQIQPDVHRTLKSILEMTEGVQEIQLYFNIQLESFGEKIVNELVQDGNFIKVNDQNKEYYCLLYSDYILNKHIAKQFEPFRRGFYRVVSGGLIQTFEPEELRNLISGTEEIDMKQLQESTSYEGGYTAQTPIIQYLWQFLHTLEHSQKKNFLTFVTGTDRVPIDGLKSLKFLIQRHSNTSNLPTAHTCFNVLMLPEYDNKQLLEKNMLLILEHNQGFGLI